MITGMDPLQAFEQISDIRKHLAKNETFKGFHPLFSAGTGLLSFILGILQLTIFSETQPQVLLYHWIMLAVCIIVFLVLMILFPAVKRGTYTAKILARRILVQFLPGLMVGGIIAPPFIAMGIGSLLPPLWALIFGLSVLSMLPYLPQGTLYISLLYFSAGTILLFIAPQTSPAIPLAMMCSFGCGHILAAIILHRNRKGG